MDPRVVRVLDLLLFGTNVCVTRHMGKKIVTFRQLH